MSTAPEEGRAPAAGHAALMDGVYRYQRHIYDLTRKYYLLGRDQMIADLGVPDGGRVLEIGCGTGRNLIAIARRYPQATAVGLDISEAMLETASRQIARHGLAGRISVRAGDASALDGLDLGQFDRVVFSYTLSMMPVWQQALEQGFARLAPGGAVQVVDFGSMAGLPGFVARGLHGWLARFHVTPRNTLDTVFQTLAGQHGATAHTSESHRGYVWQGRAESLPSS